MGVEIRQLRGGEMRAQLDALAFLRIAVFEDYPYLYAGDIRYERNYLARLASAEGAVVIGAFAADRLVGTATASPMRQQGDGFCDAMEKAGYRPDALFCFGESVLLPEYRGQGIGHRFFDERERLARQAGTTHTVFCAIAREDDDHHAARPGAYVSPEGFWRRRGYAPIDGATMTMAWEEHGGEMVDHTMQFWARPL